MTKSDPYLEIDFCVDRLVTEWQKHGKLIIALDFDNTIYDYHNLGFTFPKLINLVKRCKKEFNFYIVIFTACAPDSFKDITKKCLDLDIEIDSINKNPVKLPFGHHGKIYYNILLDDRAGLGSAFEILWKTLEKINAIRHYSP